MMTELIGWISTLILCATISRQVYTQWKTKSTEGVSHWLFLGQLAASLGFVVYSFLLENWVFVFSNVFMLVTALIGQVLYLRNRKNSPDAKDPAEQRNKGRGGAREETGRMQQSR